jgi:uncharacterized membrane protein
MILTPSPSRLSRVTFLLFCLFCVAYIIAVIGVAFNVHPPFSMTWAGSVLLILEGLLMAIAIIDMYALLGLIAVLVTGLLAYGIEALGANTGFPFGTYHYTNVLAPLLPGGVPLAVIFAWITIMLAVRQLIYSPTFLFPGRLPRIVLASLFATLLDLSLEPTAFHLEHYWLWLHPGFINYYGVPLVNFVAWFVITFVLLTCINGILRLAILLINPASFISRLPLMIPFFLYAASIFMFGFIDLTHGYYLGLIFALLAGLLMWIVSPLPRYPRLLIADIDGIEEDQAFKPERERMKKTKKARKKKRR